jgi:UDPglucose--hexose-1-phosphate uridylyltransferase
MQEFTTNTQIKYALLFENKGELSGVSNPHPHCQIYATDFVFKHTEQQLHAAEEYHQATARNLFGQIIENELEEGVRIVAQNSGAVAFIPFFARYAYEVMIFPKKRHATFVTMSDTELYDLAAVFREVIRRYNLNFQMSFPYVMSVQQAPVDGNTYPLYHLHLSILPPLRQPGLIKYLAGPEIGGGNFMADTMPEEKAAELRKVNPAGINSDPVDPYFTCFELYTLNSSLTYSTHSDTIPILGNKGCYRHKRDRIAGFAPCYRVR